MKFAKRVLRKLSKAVAKAGLATGPVAESRDLDLFLDALLRSADAAKRLNDPLFFVQQLRASFAPRRLKTVEIRGGPDPSDEHCARFSRLLEALRTSVPSLPTDVAWDVASTADAYLGDYTYLRSFKTSEGRDRLWAADVASTMGRSSSFARRGRLLYQVVRFMRPTICVEAGSFFGMSGLYLSHALTRIGRGCSLHTIESAEELYRKASALLTSRFPDVATCHHGRTQNVLPDLVRDLPPIDFFFHDATHSRAAYVRDFQLVLDGLRPGSVVLFDDIRLPEVTRGVSTPGCYEGWREVASHPRVARAAEIGSEMGILLLG